MSGPRVPGCTTGSTRNRDFAAACVSSTLPALRNPLDRKELAAAVARDILAGAVVNLGIGLPTKVADFIPPEKDKIRHTENGVNESDSARRCRLRNRSISNRRSDGLDDDHLLQRS